MFMMACFRLCLLVALSFVIRSLQQNTINPVTDFCRRWGHRTAQIDGRLYIDGGMVRYNQRSLNDSNQYLLFSDLESPPRDPSNMPVQFANLSKPASVPSVSGGYLWADETNKCFYQFGGEYPPGYSPTDFSIWTYDVLLNQWNSTKYTSRERSLQRLSFGAGTQVESLGLGYYYGGWLNNRTTPGWTGPDVATSNIVEFDFSQGSLNNNTGPDNIGRAEGQIVSLPVSDRGVLIYFGGIEDPFHNGSTFAANMSKIHIYDIASGRWYNQTASGEVPLPRRQFCADVTWPDDKSSFNIYLYGGYGFGERAAFNDVYILSLPSFKWIKAYPMPGVDTIIDPDPAGHGGCTANVVNRDQMLVIGGSFPDPSHIDCDAPKAQGQHNMILGNDTKRQYIWDDYHPELSTYVVPPVVISAIGGGPTGGATVTAPASWNHPDLKNYYQLRPSFSARTATRTVPSPTASPSPTPSSSGKTNIAAIVGGTVGGLVVLIAVLCLILFCVHRRKRARKNDETHGTLAPPPAELAVTALPQEMSTPDVNKSISAHERPDYDTHTNYSGNAALHPRSGSYYQASPYSAQGPPAYGFTQPAQTEYAQQTNRNSDNELFFSHASPNYNAQPASWDPQATSPQSAVARQRQYSYPTPTSPLQHQAQPQIYYPPPVDPSARSQGSQPSFSDQRGSPTGTQYSGETQRGHTPNVSTMTTPAHFYAQPMPIGSPGMSDGGARSPIDRRPVQGRFTEAGHM